MDVTTARGSAALFSVAQEAESSCTRLQLRRHQPSAAARLCSLLEGGERGKGQASRNVYFPPSLPFPSLSSFSSTLSLEVDGPPALLCTRAVHGALPVRVPRRLQQSQRGEQATALAVVALARQFCAVAPGSGRLLVPRPRKKPASEKRMRESGGDRERLSRQRRERRTKREPPLEASLAHVSLTSLPLFPFPAVAERIPRQARDICAQRPLDLTP